MIPTGGGGTATIGSANSGGGFPTPPTGSPGEISQVARLLSQAAAELEQTQRGLTNATEALVADWAGYAANAYRSSSGALAAASRGAGASLRECAAAVSGYGAALETAQAELTRLRGLYEEAKAREAAAAATAATLGGHLASAKKPAAMHQLQGDISGADHQASGAGEEASGYAQRALQVLDEFHREENRYMQTLAGGADVAAGRSLPAGSPFAAPFAGVGATGPGFGVPYTEFGGIVPGGLAGYEGVIPVGNPWNSDIPGYGTYLDSRTQNLQPTSDLTDAITFLAAPVAGKAAEELLVTGGRAFMEDVGIGSTGREAAAQAGRNAEESDFFSGNFRTGDPLNSAKLARGMRANRLATAAKQAAQDETRTRVLVNALDVLNRASVIPTGVKEAAEHVLRLKPYYMARFGQSARALMRFFGR